MTEPVATTTDPVAAPVPASAAPDSLLSTATPASFGDWRDEVPAKFIKDGEVDHLNLVKSYRHLETKMRAGDAPPEAADKYDVKLPEGVEMTDAIKAEVEQHKARAHELGLTQAQFDEYTSDLYSLADEIRSSIEPSREKTETALKEAWGKEYDQNLGLAIKAFQRYGSDDDKATIGNNPAALRLLAKIGAELGEDRSPAHGQAVNESMAQLRADPDYTNPHSPRYKILQDKVMELTRQRLANN